MTRLGLIEQHCTCSSCRVFDDGGMGSFQACHAVCGQSLRAPQCPVAPVLHDCVRRLQKRDVSEGRRKCITEEGTKRRRKQINESVVQVANMNLMKYFMKKMQQIQRFQGWRDVRSL